MDIGKEGQKVVQELLKFLNSMGVKVVTNSTAFTKWAINNPALAAALVKIMKNGVHAVKAIDWPGLMKAVAEARQGGASIKEILVGLGEGSFKAAGGKGALIAGIGKIAGLMAAMAWAKATLKAAGSAFKIKTDKIKSEGVNARNLWELYWETSIPVATFRQLQAFGNSVKRFFTGSKKDESVQEGTSREIAPQDRVPTSKQEELGEFSAALKSKYDEAAKQGGFVTRPTNSQAEYEWQKEVGKFMNKKNLKGKNIGKGENSNVWYFQGLAAKLAGASLTWTGQKENDVYPFVATCGIHTSLMLPIKNQGIHEQWVANANIEFQALRGKNTGAFNYNLNEVIYYDIQMSSCIALYRYIRKLIAASNTTDATLVYLPQKLLSHHIPSGSKLMFDDIILNKSNYITKLNSIGKTLNSYAFKGRTLNSRWNYLADKCIKDYNGDKAIYGIYIITNVPYVDLSDNNTIKYFNTESQGMTALLAKLESMVDDIAKYTDANGQHALIKLAGDMIKLLGASVDTFDNVPYLDGTEKLEFSYDVEANDQIRNAMMFPIYGTPTVLTDAATGIKLESPVSEAHTSNNTNIVDPSTIKIADPNNPWIMVSERQGDRDVKSNVQMAQFVANFKKLGSTPASSAKIEITECGTSLMNYMTVTLATITDNPSSIKYVGLISVWNGVDTAALVFGGISTLYGTSATAYTDWINYLTQIDFCPRFQLVYVNATGSYQYFDWLDIDNYAIITEWQYGQFNNVAVYSQSFVFTPDQVKITSLLE